MKKSPYFCMKITRFIPGIRNPVTDIMLLTLKNFCYRNLINHFNMSQPFKIYLMRNFLYLPDPLKIQAASRSSFHSGKKLKIGGVMKI